MSDYIRGIPTATPRAEDGPIWMVLTPSGYVRRRLQGPRELVEQFCRDHYIEGFWRLEVDRDSHLEHQA